MNNDWVEKNLAKFQKYPKHIAITAVFFIVLVVGVLVYKQFFAYADPQQLWSSPFNATVSIRVLEKADIDGDGKDEIAFVDNNRNFKVLRSDGTQIPNGGGGTFTLTAAPYNMAVGDISGDGKLDFIVPNGSTNPPFRVYRYNSGTGQINEHSITFGTAAAMNVNMVVYGDFTNDSVEDIIAIQSNGNDDVNVFNKTGTRTHNWIPAAGSNVLSIAFAKNTGTNRVLAVTNLNNNIYLYNKNNTTAQNTVNGNTAHFNSAAGDINNDGIEDFVFASRNTAGNNWFYIIRGNDGGIRSSVTNSGNLGAVYDIKISELTGDALNDVILGTGTAQTGTQSRMVKVQDGANTTTGATDTTAESAQQATDIYGVEAGEVDGNTSTKDIVAALQNGPIMVFQYNTPTLTDPGISLATFNNNGINVGSLGNIGAILLARINSQDNIDDIVIGDDTQYVHAYTLDRTAPVVTHPSLVLPDISNGVAGATYSPTTAFWVYLDESAFVTLKVYSDAARNNLVSTLASVYAANTKKDVNTWVYSRTWDGSGLSPNADGTYYYSIIATDNETNTYPGVTSTNTTVYANAYMKLELDLTAPYINIAGPASDGATVLGTVNITGAVYDPHRDGLDTHFLDYAVDYEQNGVGNWTNITTSSTAKRGPNDALATWNTTSPTELNGQYRIRITARDKYGHTTTAYRLVNVQNDTTGPNIALTYFKDVGLTVPLTLDSGTPITTIGSVYVKVYAAELMNSSPRLTISNTVNNNRTNIATTRVSDSVYYYKWDIINEGAARATATVAVAAYDQYNNATDNATQVTGKNVYVDTYIGPTTINNPTFNAGTGNIELTWSGVPEVYQYKIYRKLGTSGVSTAGAPYWTVTAAAYNDWVGTVTQSVYYRVVAVDIVGNISADSNEVYVTAPVPTTLTLTASPAAVVANDVATSAITARLVDQYGNAISGQQINFAITLGTGTLSAPNATTNASGNATVTIKSGTVNTVTVTGTVNSAPTLQGTTGVSFTPLADSIDMNPPPPGIPANNTTTSTVSARPLAGGSPLADGTAVTFTIIAGTGTFSDGTVSKTVYTSTGVASVQVRSGTVGTVTVQAQAAGASNTANVSVSSQAVTSITVSASPTTIIANGVQTSTITATVFDQAGQPMGSGVSVSFTTTLGNLSAGSANTNGSGQAGVTLTSTSAGTAAVTATYNSYSANTNVTLEIPDTTPPTLFKAEPTSKQLLYLSFSEPIQFNAPVSWYIYKYVNGSYSGTVSYNNAPERVNSDKRIVRVAVNESTYGNQYPNPVRYKIVVSGVSDLNNNVLDAVYNSAYYDSYTAHGKYAKAYATDVDNSRLCGQCHVSHSANRAQLLNKTTIKKVCFICHGSTGISEYKVESEFISRTANGSTVSYTLHKALDVDNPAGNDVLYCTDCHNPHGDKRTGNEIYPKLLKAFDVAGTVYYQGNGYCLACHGANNKLFKTQNNMSAFYNATGGDHRWGMGVNGNKDIANRPIPHYDYNFSIMNPASGTQVTCVKCHERHGSRNSSLVLDPATDPDVTNAREKICYNCHNTTTPNSMSVDVQAKFGLASKHDILDPTNIGLTCSSCHGPHSVARRTFAASGGTLPSDISDPTNTKNNYNTSSGDFAGFCNKCHDVSSGITVSQTINSGTIVPYNVYMPGTSFTSTGTGWNKKQYYDANSGNPNTVHYVQGIMCDKCHDPHGSANPRLMTLGEDPSTAPNTTSGLCLRCHGGGATPTGRNVWTNQFAVSGAGTSEHPTLSNGSVIHSDTETIYSTTSDMVRHAECYDCHDPHAARNGSAEIDPIRGATGVSINWGAYTWSNYGTMPRTNFSLVTLDGTAGKTNQYQVCMKCHSKYAYRPVTANGETTLRAPHTNLSDATFNQTDVAREFNPNVKSKHIVIPGYPDTSTNINIRATDGNFSGSWADGRQLTLTRNSVLKCTDCHTAATGTVRGPHGSTNKFLLIAPWNPTGASGTKTGTAGTGTHLCFRCHSFSFYTGTTGTSAFSDGGNLHGKSTHATAGCAACHGGLPHGWSYANATYGVPMFKTTDPPPYNTGAWLSNFSLQNPGSWGGQHGGTGCTLSGCSG